MLTEFLEKPATTRRFSSDTSKHWKPAPASERTPEPDEQDEEEVVASSPEPEQDLPTQLGM